MSKPDDESELRLCRVDGRQPTARERWKSFHRLWRLAHGHGAHHDHEAGMAFRTLLSDWRYIHMLDDDRTDGLTDRSHIPKFLRKQLLSNYRKHRLYGGGNYEWIERDKATACRIREKEGVEVTPLEVAEVRWKIMQAAKRASAECGLPAPRNYDELMAMMREGQ